MGVCQSNNMSYSWKASLGRMKDRHDRPRLDEMLEHQLHRLVEDQKGNIVLHDGCLPAVARTLDILTLRIITLD
jgi:hypothetical protein